MNSTEIQTLGKLLAQPKKIIIVPHKNPDGDALGASLALYLFLKSNHHKVSVVSPNDYPQFLKWMPAEKEVLKFDQEPEACEKLISEAEIIFTLDFNHFSRAGGDMEKVLEKAQADFVMIDHHQQPGDYARFMESDINMCSTAQMIYHFFERLERLDAITPAIASCLYAGIMTDTGSFRFPLTTSKTHRVIADLMDHGAKNAKIHEQVYDTNSYNKMQLLGVALNNLKLVKEFHTAYISLSQKELDAHNFKKGDTEGFVNYALSVKGIVFAAIFIENKAEGIVKISLRSKGSFDVNEFARECFDGGGHQNAAGGRSEKSLEETVKNFLAVLPRYKKELS